jgi:integrase
VSNETVPKSERKAPGSIEWVGSATSGCWHAKVSIGGKRPRFKLKDRDGRWLTDRKKDRCLAKLLAEEMAAQLRSDDLLLKTALKSLETVEQFGERWTSGELYKEFGEVRRLRPKKSARDDHNRLNKYIYPYIGKMHVSKVTEEDVERCFARAHAEARKRNGKELSQDTKRHLYMVAHRMFDLAVKPGRLRSDNPVSVDLLPSKGRNKIYSFLYPDELLQLLNCTLVPLVRRVYYASACYTGLRKGTLRVSKWVDFDFEHNVIVALKTKTDVPLMFAQTDPQLPGLVSLMTLLRRYREHLGWPNSNAFVISTNLECKKDSEAETLRADLKTAGVTRKILFSESSEVEPLRFHDLRATFVTWARRAGKGEGWISDRTGHITSAMMRRYDRGARSLVDLKYVPFPDLSTAIPELAKDSNVARIHPR